MPTVRAVLFAMLAVTACGAPGLVAARTVDTKAGKVAVETFAQGLDHPWGMAFLPDGRLLVTAVGSYTIFQRRR